MLKRWLPEIVFLSAVAIISVMALYTNRAMKKNTIVITDQDIVRYCMDRRREKADAQEIKYYCDYLGGDYYIAQGVKPNYDKYPSYRMFPAPTGEKP